MKHDRRLQICFFMLQLFAVVPCSAEIDSTDAYTAGVLPFVQKYCVECHTGEKAKGELDLTRFAKSSDVAASFRRWNNVIEFIRGGEMPPEDAEQPTIDESEAFVSNIEAILVAEATKNAGDPGVILPRRLSNTEYDLSIRELTGVDIRPTKDFPADPAGGEGFDNTGEALGMSPNLLKKYLAAAELVANHLVLKTAGISFAPYPVTSYNERKKLTEQAIINFYESHAVDTLKYLEAAWRYRHRGGDQQEVSIQQWAESQGLSANYLAIVWKTLAEATSPSSFLQELGQVWEAVPAPVDTSNRPSELLALRDFVEFGRRVISAPEPQLIHASAGNWPISHLDFRAKTAAVRDKFDAGSLKNETLLRIVRVSAPAANDKAPQSYSAFIRIDQAFSDSDDFVIFKRPVFSKADRLPNNEAEEKEHEVLSLRSLLEESNSDLVNALGFGKHPAGGEIDPESFVVKAPSIIEIPITVEMQRKLDGKHLLVQCQLDPERSKEGSVFVQHSVREPAQSKFGNGVELLIYRDSEATRKLAESAAVFCNAFPNRFCYVDSGRGLAAGFHLVEGFFRDDRPLVEKVLDDKENAELNQLWRELDFVTQSAESLLRGFVWFERSEREVLHDKRFDFLRSEDPELVENSLLTKFEKLYLDKMGIKRVDDTLEAESPDHKYEMIHGFFQQIRQGLTLQKDLMKLAEQRALTDLEELTRRAYRRVLSAPERESLHSLYGKLREDGQEVEAAIRGVLTAVLMSPEFCYRYQSVPDGKGIYPLSDNDLASRLSYFLWSSSPDEELLTTAAAGKLQDEDELLAQTRLMLKNEKISAFAREFFGQWLRYRDYLSKDPINAEAFPGYDDRLREAMFDEPVRLATYLIQTDQPITDLLNSDMTFVNRALAKHYGGELEQQYQEMSKTSADDQAWQAVTGLKAAGRGGLFGMAVILTKNSAGERTSPVKRGFWSVHHLLGQHFPPPPADVPKLPATENGADRTIRELLAAHVADAQCVLCHKHFDSLGVAMEGFDPIGRSRTKDRAGRPIDNVAELPNGESATGIPGLIDYIEQHRRQDFVRTMCRKFLGYALGRSVKLSDQSLLEEMEMALEKNGYRFSMLFEVVVRSPQFRQQRGRDFSFREDEAPAEPNLP
ncbi:MAG: DUF1592 domain-containing protein [Planctomycetota bacterium]|nr:DUF1592 domain-containing protein [Planctomycetota bacterium]